MEINATEITRLMLESYKRYRRGEITERTALGEVNILGNILKAIETKETEERLRAIENALTSTKNTYEDE